MCSVTVSQVITKGCWKHEANTSSSRLQTLEAEQKLLNSLFHWVRNVIYCWWWYQERKQNVQQNSPPLSQPAGRRGKVVKRVWTQGAAVSIVTFAGSKAGKFPVSLSLPLLPAHLRTQLLPAQAGSTDVQNLQERSPTVLCLVLGQNTGTCAVYGRLL